MNSKLCACVLLLVWSGPVCSEMFEDKTKPAGIEFVHFNGMAGKLYYPETMGSGAALLDYDGDGDLDVYLVQSSFIGADTETSVIFKPDGDLRDHLYRNDTEPGGALRFVDVTEASGIDARGYGMGVAVGDVNNDGAVDIYVTNFGANQLWLNQGDGTFKDVSVAWAVDDAGWAVSASFLDMDGDEFLDLYVANYISYDVQNPKVCKNETSVEDYCGPQAFDGAMDRLYRNKGGRGFEDITVAAGTINKATGMGVISADFNDDQQVDIFVANDGMPNFLWVNNGDGTFKNQALLAGVAVNREGMTEASMGVDAADFDNDGDEDLFMTHLIRETNTLYVNDGKGWFDERTAEFRLSGPSVRYTSFGSAWFDPDNDGDLDLFVANGGVSFFESPAKTRDDPYPLHRVNQLFIREGNIFHDKSQAAGSVFKQSDVSRGASFGDLDNDGDTDILVSNNAGPVRLLVNTLGQDSTWIGLIPKSADGVLLTNTRVLLGKGPTHALTRRSRSDGSYASANDPRILIGLGTQAETQDIKVIWPSGDVEYWSDLAPGRYHEITRGTGKSN